MKRRTIDLTGNADSLFDSCDSSGYLIGDLLLLLTDLLLQRKNCLSLANKLAAE
jgi:hypothetical protein